MQSCSLTTTDGVRLRVESVGNGTTMLLCNGLFCTTQYYVPWCNHFQQSHRIVQFDYRSHGGSDDDPNPSNVTIEQLVNDASLVFESLCDERTIVVGHSMGVRVALDIFARYPNRVSCLILLCGNAFDSLGTILSRAPLRNTVLGILRCGDYVPAIGRAIKDISVRFDLVTKIGISLGGMSRNTPREPIDALLSNVDRLDVRMMTTLTQSYIQHSALELLPKVDVPTLLIVGDKDSFASPSHANEVMKKMPNAQRHVLAGCTHLAPVEKPDEIHSVVDAFLDSVIPGRA